MTQHPAHWCHEALVELITPLASDPSLERLWPAIEEWLQIPAPNVDPKNDWIWFQVSRGSSGIDLPGLEPPEELASQAIWFRLGVTREVHDPDPEFGEHGLEFYYAADAELDALMDDPDWDTENLFGLDIAAYAGPAAQDILTHASVKSLEALFSSKAAALVVLQPPDDTDERILGGWSAP